MTFSGIFTSVCMLFLFAKLLETMPISEDTTSFALPVSQNKSVIEFVASSTAVLENEGRVRVRIRRHGCINNLVVFKVDTINGNALAGEDYKAVHESMKFVAGKTLRILYIEIVDDKEWEPDEYFFVYLSVETDQQTLIGNTAVTTISILNDDELLPER